MSKSEVPDGIWPPPDGSGGKTGAGSEGSVGSSVDGVGTSGWFGVAGVDGGLEVSLGLTVTVAVGQPEDVGALGVVPPGGTVGGDCVTVTVGVVLGQLVLGEVLDVDGVDSLGETAGLDWSGLTDVLGESVTTGAVGSIWMSGRSRSRVPLSPVGRSIQVLLMTFTMIRLLMTVVVRLMTTVRCGW